MTTSSRQRGAALMLAMVVLTLVATLAAGMVWQQQRSVQLEGAERATGAAEWVLQGALDWARLILREDGRSSSVDTLAEVWATPLAEARLSSFLAADRDNNASAGEDEGVEAFLSGAIVDAQSRYNLRNLFEADGSPSEVQKRGLERVCEAAAVPTDTAARIVAGLRAAWYGEDSGSGVPLPPTRIAQLTWLGLDAATVAKLEPLLALLPVRTPVNANTAAAPVLLAAIDGLDLATAARIVQSRPFDKLADLQSRLPNGTTLDDKRINIKSSYFDVYGRLRLENRVLEQHTLVERRGNDRSSEVVALQRDQQALTAQRQ